MSSTNPASDEPSKVLFLRNLHRFITERDVSDFCKSLLAPANVSPRCYVCPLKGHAFIEFQCIQHAQYVLDIINSPNAPQLRNAYPVASFSRRQYVRTQEDLAKLLAHSSKVLLIHIVNYLEPVDLMTLKLIFSNYGTVEKILTFSRDATSFQAMIQMSHAAEATLAQETLDGLDLIPNGNTLRVQFSTFKSLTIRYNNSKSMDFTRPDLPSNPSHELKMQLAKFSNSQSSTNVNTNRNSFSEFTDGASMANGGCSLSMEQKSTTQEGNEPQSSPLFGLSSSPPPPGLFSNSSLATSHFNLLEVLEQESSGSFFTSTEDFSPVASPSHNNAGVRSSNNNGNAGKIASTNLPAVLEGHEDNDEEATTTNDIDCSSVSCATNDASNGLATTAIYEHQILPNAANNEKERTSLAISTSKSKGDDINNKDFPKDDGSLPLSSPQLSVFQKEFFKMPVFQSNYGGTNGRRPSINNGTNNNGSNSNVCSYYGLPQNASAAFEGVTIFVGHKKRVVHINQLPHELLDCQRLFNLCSSYGSLLALKINTIRNSASLLFDTAFGADTCRRFLTGVRLVDPSPSSGSNAAGMTADSYAIDNELESGSEESLISSTGEVLGLIFDLKARIKRHFKVSLRKGDLGLVINPHFQRFSGEMETNFVSKYACRPCRVLHVTNVAAPYFNEETLARLFRKFGQVMNVTLLYSKNSNHHTSAICGTCQVVMNSTFAAIDALVHLHNFDFLGKRLKVSFSKPSATVTAISHQSNRQFQNNSLPSHSPLPSPLPSPMPPSTSIASPSLMHPHVFDFSLPPKHPNTQTTTASTYAPSPFARPPQFDCGSSSMMMNDSSNNTVSHSHFYPTSSSYYPASAPLPARDITSTPLMHMMMPRLSPEFPTSSHHLNGITPFFTEEDDNCFSSFQQLNSNNISNNNKNTNMMLNSSSHHTLHHQSTTHNNNNNRMQQHVDFAPSVQRDISSGAFNILAMADSIHNNQPTSINNSNKQSRHSNVIVLPPPPSSSSKSSLIAQQDVSPSIPSRVSTTFTQVPATSVIGAQISTNSSSSLQQQHTMNYNLNTNSHALDETMVVDGLLDNLLVCMSNPSSNLSNNNNNSSSLNMKIINTAASNNNNSSGSSSSFEHGAVTGLIQTPPPAPVFHPIGNPNILNSNNQTKMNSSGILPPPGYGAAPLKSQQYEKNPSSLNANSSTATPYYHANTIVNSMSNFKNGNIGYYEDHHHQPQQQQHHYMQQHQASPPQSPPNIPSHTQFMTHDQKNMQVFY